MKFVKIFLFLINIQPLQLLCQEVKISLVEPNKKNLTEQPIIVEATIYNNTSAPISIFVLDFEEYGVMSGIWTLNVNGKEKKIQSRALDQLEKFDVGVIRSVAPVSLAACMALANCGRLFPFPKSERL